MADAEDLKSSGDFSSWGFDSPPGHHILCKHKHLGPPIKNRRPEALRETAATFAYLMLIAGERLCSMRLAVEGTRGARELCAVAISAEDLEACRIALCFHPSPKFCSACTEIVCFA